VNANTNYWSLAGVNEVGNVLSYRDEVFNETKLASYFGRFQYKLMDRYLFTGTIRQDGSSNFAKEYRYFSSALGMDQRRFYGKCKRN
jgi:hypothetical protein